ncbi:MAG: DUF2339 domain-containing protein, partial [Betaproteobacteria bacterium]
MLIAIGILAGLVLGAAFAGFQGAIAGAFSGLIIALALRSRSELVAHNTRVDVASAQQVSAEGPRATTVTPGSAPPLVVATAPARSTLTVPERLTAIEARLARIEAEMTATLRADDTEVMALRDEVRSVAPIDAAATGAISMAPDSPVEPRTPLGPIEPVAPIDHRAAPAPADFVLAPDGTLARAAAANHESRRAASAAAAPNRASVEPVTVAVTNPVWAWITGGNLLTRVGVVILFFGVAFLLRYFAEMITVSIEVKLTGVALAGGALIAGGMWLARRRPGYGISLAGAGAGILYLTTYAALRLYEVLPPVVALVLLVAIALLTVGLAVRSDAQPLAGLAIAGGFLAPFLVASTEPSPLPLFSYFAVLNAAIFVLAWLRSWRALNVLGFIFTFMLGLVWGHQFYRPQHFAIVQPFLVLFFLFYVTIAVLYAARAPLRTRAPVDGLLVFGVPLIGFALQTGLVRDQRYGAAISAFVLAAFYGVLAASLCKRKEAGLALLSRAFLVLAIIFV